MAKIDIFSTDKKYNIIYADPPWRYQDRKCNGACEFHYPTMNIKDICDIPINKIADKDCVLFLWATYPMLKEALDLIEAWGFKYKTIGFQWVKQNKSGNGFFFWTWEMDTGQYGVLFDCNKREAQKNRQQCKPTDYRANSSPFSKTERMQKKNNTTYGRFAKN